MSIEEFKGKDTPKKNRGLVAFFSSFWFYFKTTCSEYVAVSLERKVESVKSNTKAGHNRESAEHKFHSGLGD